MKKAAHNDDEDSVKVVARFRPFNTRELTFGNLDESEDMMIITDTSIQVNYPGHPELTFLLNRVFDKGTTQDQMYHEVGAELIEHFLGGFNVTIFAYGQTGAGKSYSMLGDVDDPEHQGLIPRVAGSLFDKIQESATTNDSVEFTISCSYLEIYQEEVRDLLNRTPKKLTIRESPSQGVYVENLTTEYVGSPDDVFDLLSIGDRMRKVASTNMNMRSSRSHTCFVIKIFQKDENDCTKEAKLNLVDLAGSERIKKTGASGQTLEEAKKINLSLTCLSHCINALTDTTKSHVPFRGSKLTRLLQESLGGNSKTTVLVACSPHIDNLEETICTLRFAERCKKVTNKAKENIQLSPAQLTKMCQKLTDEIANMKLYTMTLEGALRRLGVDPRALEDGTLEIDSKKPVSIRQTTEKGTSITPRKMNDDTDDLVVTYENETVIAPSKQVIKNQKLNELPPPGQTYVTSTITLKDYNLDTFGKTEQDKFLQGVVAAMANDEITLDVVKILDITAGSVNVTFRVQAPTFLASAISDTVQSEAMATSLAKTGLKTKGMTVTKKPYLTRGTVRPKDIEDAEKDKHKKVDGMPSLEFFNMGSVKLDTTPRASGPPPDRTEIERLSNQIVELKAENEALQSEIEEQKKITAEVQVENDQAVVQIDALHERVRALLMKFENNEPLTERDLSAPKLGGVEINVGSFHPDRDVAVVPEPTDGSAPEKSVNLAPGTRIVPRATAPQRSAQVARRSRRIDTTTATAEDVDKPAPARAGSIESGRRVPQLFVPMDQSQIEGEYRTFVATNYAEPVVPRKRDDDEFEALDKVKELQATVDRQADIVERQSILLAHQDKLNKQQAEDLRQLRQDKAELEARLSEQEMRLLEVVREAQPGVTSVDYRGMGYGGRRPNNIRMPVRNNDSLLAGGAGAAAPGGPGLQPIMSTRNSARTTRTVRTARVVDRKPVREPGMMAGVFAMISDILEFEKGDEEVTKKPDGSILGGGANAGIAAIGSSQPSASTLNSGATTANTQLESAASLDLRARSRNQKASSVQRPKSPPQPVQNTFSVGKIFGL